MNCTRCQSPLADGARFCSTCGTDQTTPTPGPGKTAITAAALQDLVARTLAGRYTVQRLLGTGGMASVFLADDLTLERAVAIKVLPTDVAHDERVVARFQREAKTAAKLDHPHIIPIYRVESEGVLNYFVMKYVEGRSLEAVLRSPEPVPIALAQRVLAEAGSALAHAHRKGVVHRDVKPANIMLDAEDRVNLTDFGISKAAEATSQLTQTGVIVGTPYYMSPEQVLSTDVDGRADQYALAILGFHMLTGQLPFRNENAHAVLYQQIHETPPRVTSLRPDVPVYLDRAIDRALAKKPADRFATMEEFVHALTGGVGAPPRSLTPPVASTPIPGRTVATAKTTRMSTPVPRRRNRWWLGVAAAVIVAAGAVGWWSVAKDHTAPLVTTAAAAPPIADTVAPAATPATSDTATRQSAPPAVTPTPVTPAPVTPAPVTPAPVTPTPVAKAPRHVARPEPRATEQVAYLTVASDPYGTLFINGVDVGVTPRADYALTVGKSYEIRVEQDGYKPKRETINVSGPNPIRRRYILEPAGSQ